MKLYNSLSKQIEQFSPINREEVRMYTCGPTVYNYAHIGNLRAYVFSDTLNRTLSHRYNVTHVINITDVGHLTDDADNGDDKMEKSANGKNIWDISQYFTDAFKKDFFALNNKEPDAWAVATDFIGEMIEFGKSIEQYCYHIPSGLYLDTSLISGYDKMAGFKDHGNARIATVDGKRNPADFAIWRSTPVGEKRQMEWVSPWGKGAPGWHLECSVMSKEVLGFPFDIHTGGIDHKEVHHPNEIAQNMAACGCEALNHPEESGARYWMHNNFLIDNGEKMKKSAGDFLTLQSLVDAGVHPLSYRLMCLQTHYRSEMEFSWDNVFAAQKRLKRMVSTTEKFKDDLGALLNEFISAMENDLNTPLALTIVEKILKQENNSTALKTVHEMLGIDFNNLTKEIIRNEAKPISITLSNDEVDELITLREKFRNERDYEKADNIRKRLLENNIVLLDGDKMKWDYQNEY